MSVPASFPIGPIQIAPATVLAPMAGVTDTVFRRLIRNQGGCGLIMTEFTSSHGVVSLRKPSKARKQTKSFRYLYFEPEEHPITAQLFGSDPVIMAEAAKVCEEQGFDAVDINFGCPVKKVVCKNGGSALLRDGELLASIASAVVRAVAPTPVTAKIRIGWDSNSVNAVENARHLESAGVARITVHGRTRVQGYSGEADWDVIAAVAAAVRIPVVGNGDITSAEVALRRWEQAQVSGLMIGRAAMTSPWIFQEIAAAIRGENAPPAPTLADRWNLIEDHCRQELQRWRKREKGMHAMRSRLMAYSRGLHSSRELRRRFGGVETLDELAAIRAWHESSSHATEHDSESEAVAADASLG